MLKYTILMPRFTTALWRSYKIAAEKNFKILSSMKFVREYLSSLLYLGMKEEATHISTLLKLKFGALANQSNYIDHKLFLRY